MYTKPWVRRLLLWGGGIVLFVLLLWGMAQLSPSVSTPTGILAVSVNSSDNSQGPATAPITLVEYSDFQCPACAAFQPVLAQLLADHDLAGKIRFVYRYFPLATIHPNAELSAHAAQAAALQGKFWQMHDLLFNNQAAWEGQSDAAARATFAKYAQQIGLDMTKYTANLDSTAVKNRVQADYDGGVQSGVDSTPSFFVNGAAMVHPTSYDQLKQLLLNAPQ